MPSPFFMCTVEASFTTTEASMLTLSPILSVPVLDRLVAVCAPLLPRVAGGGLFWHPARPTGHLDAYQSATAVYVQVGKLELILDRA